jgi:hypothetical protein
MHYIPNSDAESLHWWLGNTMEEMIRWYLGQHSTSAVQNHSIRLYDKLNKLLHTAHANFNASNGVTFDVLWDQQHLREFHKDHDKTPFVRFTTTQKRAHRKILYKNRRIRASNQTSQIIRSTILQETPPT